MIVVTQASPVEGITPPVVDGPPRSVAPLSYQWVGWDGAAWNLTDFGGKVIKGKGATGFGPADETHWYSDAAGIPGSSWDGSRTERGRLFVPVHIFGDDSADYLSTRRAFARTLDPKRLGTMIVTTPDQGSRWANCRYASGLGAEPVDLDPVASCHELHGITWDRPDPHWHGPDVVATFTVDPPPEFFEDDPGTGNVVNIADGTSMDEAKVDNSGEVESYAQVIARGPSTAFEVGVGDAIIAMSVTLANADEYISIDMDPRVLSIVDHLGVDRWTDATDRAFPAIPPGSQVPVWMAMTGTGSIEMRFPTNFRSAW